MGSPGQISAEGKHDQTNISKAPIWRLDWREGRGLGESQEKSRQIR